MSITKRVFALSALLLLVAGCSTVTNLTASRQPRMGTNLYLVEATLQSNEQAMIPGSVQPYVLVGNEQIPMERVPVVKGRWQAYIPVPAGEPDVRYRFRFDYAYYSVPVQRTNSILSPEYKLTIRDR